MKIFLDTTRSHDGKRIKLEAMDSMEMLFLRVGSNRNKHLALSREDAENLADALDEFLTEAEEQA